MEKCHNAGCCIYSTSLAWSAMNPVILVSLSRKHLPDLKDVWNVFLIKSKSEILDMVCTAISFENINKEILKNGYRVMNVKWASST
jgi:hypothetical protein